MGNRNLKVPSEERGFQIRRSYAAIGVRGKRRRSLEGLTGKNQGSIDRLMMQELSQDDDVTAKVD
jgi:hypothetical protein